MEAAEAGPRARAAAPAGSVLALVVEITHDVPARKRRLGSGHHQLAQLAQRETAAAHLHPGHTGIDRDGEVEQLVERGHQLETGARVRYPS